MAGVRVLSTVERLTRAVEREKANAALLQDEVKRLQQELHDVKDGATLRDFLKTRKAERERIHTLELQNHNLRERLNAIAEMARAK
jgi:cell division protein FtsB